MTAKQYQRAIYRKHKRLATWEPDDAIAVGDVGVLHRGTFRRETDLETLGIAYTVDDANQSVGDYRSFSSTSGLALRSEAEARVPQGLARVIAQLQKAGTFAFEALGVSQKRLRDPRSVTEQLRSIRETKGWDRRWIMIDQVWHVERGTIIVATGGGSEVAMTVRGDAGPGLRALAKVDAGMDVEVRGRDVYKLLGARNFTPLYTAWTFNLWGRKKYLSKDGDAAAEDGSPPTVGLDELMDSWR